MTDQASSSSSGSLTGGRLLARNSLWNLLGNASPLVAAALAMPYLVSGLGTTRFGLLTLAWAFIGYLGLFDLGLGRSLTKLIADRLGDGRTAEIPAVAGTGLALLAGLGMVGAVVGTILSAWFVADVLNTPPDLQREGALSFLALSLSLPIVVVTAGLRGVLAAYQRFDLINLVRIPLGSFTYLSPLAVLPFTDSLLPVVLVLVGGRLLALAIYAALCRRALPNAAAFRFEAGSVRELVAFGRWLTVSNIVGPLLGYLDRFLIGAIVTVAVVAYYTTPYEVVTKLWLVPSAILAVLFPVFATTIRRDPERTARLLRIGTASTYLILAPVVLLTVAFATEGLELWLGTEFAVRSAPVLRLLAIGVLVNSLAQIASALVQGLGRPDITAKLHVAELVFYWPLLWFLVARWGLTGAAWAWLLRVSIDGAALYVVSARLLPPSRSLGLRLAGAVVASAAAALATLQVEDPAWRALAALAGGVVVAGIAWRGLMSSGDRGTLRGLLHRPAPTEDARTAPE